MPYTLNLTCSAGLMSFVTSSIGHHAHISFSSDSKPLMRTGMLKELNKFGTVKVAGKPC